MDKGFPQLINQIPPPFDLDKEFDEHSMNRDPEPLLALIGMVARHSTDGIVITEMATGDPQESHVVYVNDAFERITGYTRDEMLGQSIYRLRGPETDPETCDWIRTRTRAVEGFRCEILNYRKNGTPVWLEIDVQPAGDFTGQCSHWVSIQREISERKALEARLRRSEEHQQRIISTIPDCIKTMDLDGRILTINENGASALEAGSPEDLAGQNWLKFLSGDAHDQASAAIAKAKRGETVQFQAYCPTAKGTPKWWDVVISPLLDDDGEPEQLLAVSRDVTILHQLLEQQRAQLNDANDRASRDALTGLYNYRVFHSALYEQANRAIARGESLAILELDIDNFKAFNDAYGHIAGDNAITQVSSLLKLCSAETDEQRADGLAFDNSILVSRVGGDEFAILFPNCTREQATQLAADLKDGVDSLRYEPELSGDSGAIRDGRVRFIPFKISIGIAMFPDDATSAVDAYRIADERALQDKIGSKSYENHELRERLKSQFEGFSMLDALVASVDSRDRYTRRHSEDVLFYALLIADEIVLNENDRLSLTIASLIGDAGKICVPDRILRQPGALSPDDYEKIKQHVAVSSALVGSMPAISHTLPAVRHHHERWDGAGYPDGLVAEEIPLLARILAVADAFTAMTADRPYRRGLHTADAVNVLSEGAGSQWDPACVQALIRELAFHSSADLLR